VAEVSRRPIPQVVQKSAASASRRQQAGMQALPKPPAAMTPMDRSTGAAPPAIAARPALVAPKLAAPRLIPPPGQAVAQVAALQSPSVQVNLPLGQDQSVLAQTFASSLAAQGSPVVRQPGSVFNAPNAAPIQGQWPTNVPGIVQQAFNASLSGTDQGVAKGASGGQMASPQMSNQAMRRLPGAPVLIRFRHGSTRLSGAEKKRLGQLANQARQAGKTVYVVGHASQRTGDMNYAKHKLVNFNVSLDRANSVAGELRRQGVSAQQIVVQAKGDAEPLYFEFMPDGEAQNRRVEVFVR
jgi:outer membrane protein OmpA-like peptidoglycan-associated protein